MRQHEAKRLAEQSHQQFTPTRQEDTLQVTANLTPDTNTSKVLANVARWHEAPWRRGIRHRLIAQALREASGTRPAAANDNRRRADRRAA